MNCAIDETIEVTEENIRQILNLAESGDATAQYLLGKYYLGVGEKEKAYGWALKSANENYSLGINLLGIVFEDGEGIVADKHKAFSLFSEAAALGLDKAQYNLGRCFEFGIGTERNEEKAFELYKTAAENGYTNAQFRLGCCFDSGKGTEIDAEKAFEWYKMAAEHGQKDAQYMLGLYYQYGNGTEKNDDKAFLWFMRAAEQGLDVAQSKVGDCYEEGLGTEVNNEEALKWQMKAALQGLDDALWKVGWHFEFGVGTESNLSKAFEWYYKSAQSQYPLGQYSVGLCYEYGIGVIADYNEAFFWYEKSAEKAFPPAQTKLGRCFKEGLGTAIDYSKAFEWFQKAAEQGDDGGQFYIGLFYHEGLIVEQNDETAFEWFLKSANQGLKEAQLNVGIFYSEGIGVESDSRQAFSWYLKAAEQGECHSQYNVANCYLNGKGVAKDERKAFNYYYKAAIQGFPWAQNNIGDLYSQGVGVECDEVKAFEWYLKSAEQGYAGAQYNLGLCYLDAVGTQKDEEKALYWFLRSVEAGYEEALIAVGFCFLWGHGTEINPSKGFEYYLRSANAGSSIGQYFVADCFENGLGTECNLEKAFEYYRYSAENGFEVASFALGNCYNFGRGTTKDDEMAYKCYLRALSFTGDFEIQQEINYGAGCFFFRNGRFKNHSKAKECFLKCENLYEAFAWNLLAILSFENNDEKNALAYVEKSSDKKNPLGLFLLAYIYGKGKCGIQKDVKQSRKYYSEALNAGLRDWIDDYDDFNYLVNGELDFSDFEFIIAKYALEEKETSNRILQSVLGKYALSIQRSIERRKGVDIFADSITIPELFWRKLPAWNPEKASFKSYISPNLKNLDWQRFDNDKYEEAWEVIKYVDKIDRDSLKGKEFCHKIIHDLFPKEGNEAVAIVYSMIQELISDYSLNSSANKNLNEESDSYKKAREVIKYVETINRNSLRNKGFSYKAIHEVFPDKGELAIATVDSRIQELLSKPKQSGLYYYDSDGEERELEFEDTDSPSTVELIVENDRSLTKENHQKRLEELKAFIYGFDASIPGQMNREIVTIYCARILLYPRKLKDPSVADGRKGEDSKNERDRVGSYFSEVLVDVSLSEIKEILVKTKHLCANIDWYYSKRLSVQPLVHPALEKRDIRNHSDFNDKQVCELLVRNSLNDVFDNDEILRLVEEKRAAFSRTCSKLDDKLKMFVDDYAKKKGINL